MRLVWSFKIYLAALSAVLAVTPVAVLSAAFISDVSKLNKTQVARIEYPSSVGELWIAFAKAKNAGLKIAVSGVRHSQGGHAFYKNAVVIDTRRLNAILTFDKANKTITVEPGVTWKQIQHSINPHGLAVQVMQTANIFTVGGSLSVNCHGRDPGYGPFIESIISFKMMLADGSLVQVSRQENAELFRLAIGGYGLFGIITEITIALTDNVIYSTSLKTMPIDHYVKFLKDEIINNPAVGLHYGQLSTTPFGYLENIFTFTHTKRGPARAISQIKAEPRVALNKLRLKMRRKSTFLNLCGGVLDWVGIQILKLFSPPASRNNAMQYLVECLVNESQTDTDILQSYFIPPASFVPFITTLRRLIKQENIHVIQVLTRYIPKNRENFLCYTKDNYIEVVLFLNIKQAPHEVKKVHAWTRKLIDFVLLHGGCYYLPVQLCATKQQLKRAYPMIDDFFDKKRQYDPQELFMNGFYAKYAERTV